MSRHRTTIASVAIAFVVLFTHQALAGFQLGRQLTGDPRPGNPDSLIVDIFIDVPTRMENRATFTVDINSPQHAGIRLDEFYFNLNLLTGQSVTFGDFSPNSSGKKWGYVSGINAAGSGSADFDFGVGQSGAGNPNNNRVDNTTTLVFDLLMTGGVFTLDTFNMAAASFGAAELGAMQMGAHLQSLDAAAGESDSGFARVGPASAIPEPGSMFVWGLIAVVLSFNPLINVAKRALMR